MSTYFLGLDIGTDSVGWAVTDEHYQIIRKRGKALWGVRLFDSAQTAEERRGYRVARRRIERRTQRLHWLQDLFAEEISKMDPAFFDRLRESKFLEEDKKSSYPLGRYTLFADQNYCDKDYHQQFPTIYHLRKALIEDSSPFDVRLVYLAIHHILKNRGHFLYGDLPLETISLERDWTGWHKRWSWKQTGACIRMSRRNSNKSLFLPLGTKHGAKRSWLHFFQWKKRMVLCLRWWS